MRIEKEYIINDEPLVATATGKRKINLVYNGPKYLYAEVDHLGKVQVITHISDNGPELAAAMEKLTPIEGRSIVEIDAEKSTLAASYFWNSYTFSLPDYVETLPGGEVYTYDYNDSTTLGEIYDFNKMTFDKNKADFAEYKFLLAPVSDAELAESINIIISKVETAKSENKSLKQDELDKLNQYITELNQFKANMASGTENWKMKFPVCTIQY